MDPDKKRCRCIGLRRPEIDHVTFVVSVRNVRMGWRRLARPPGRRILFLSRSLCLAAGLLGFLQRKDAVFVEIRFRQILENFLQEGRILRRLLRLLGARGQTLQTPQPGADHEDKRNT